MNISREKHPSSPAATLTFRLIAFMLLPVVLHAVGQDQERYKIQWRDFTFYTNQPLPTIDRELSIRSFPAMEKGYYFVQFTGPITKAMKERVTAAGGELLTYVPNNAFITRMDAASKAEVEKLPIVQWVYIYQPAMRISKYVVAKIRGEAVERPKPLQELVIKEEGAVVTPPTKIQLTVLVFEGENLSSLRQEMADLGVEVLSVAEGKRGSRFMVSAPLDKAAKLAMINGVMWVEEYSVPELSNDTSRLILNVNPVWTAHGLHGNNQIIGVSDSGIDSGVNDTTMHDDIEGRIVNIFSWAVQPGTGALNTGADDGAADLDHGHGTHTTGSALGNGTRSGGTYSGVAPQAQLVFQAIEQFTDYPGTANDGYSLTGIPADLNNLFQQSYDAGARVQTNSWNSTAGLGSYNAYSQDVDEFVWDNPDMLIVYSAGNYGEDADGNSVVDLCSIAPPATAKNALAVGAAENNRPAVPQTYGRLFGATIDTDRKADNIDGMAAFSSRGAANCNTATNADDRIKPDLVAPGTMVASTRTQASPNTILVNDDMEGGAAGWTSTGAWAQVNTDSHSPNTSWHDSPAGNYANNVNSTLTSPTRNLNTGGLGPKYIQLWVRYDLNTGDQWTMEFSNNGGGTWPWATNPIAGDRGWELFTVYLGQLSNEANFRFRFRFESDNDGASGDGIYIDDVRIVEGAFNTALLSDFNITPVGSVVDQQYLLMNGTSMAAPLTAGCAAIVRQYYMDELDLEYVSAALVRATLINGATDMTPGQYGVGATQEMGVRPNNVEGWGRVNLENSLFPAAPAVLSHVDEIAGLDTGESRSYSLVITNAGVPVSVTMVYHDYPGAAIVNNLDLTVTPPGGGTLFPNGLTTTDTRNNVEQIVVPAPVVGTYTITVDGQNVPQGPQPYAIVMTAGGTLTVERDPVDVALVLDLSGSMLSPACPSGCDTKLNVLKDAVELFISLWTAVAVPNDRMALNYFRTNIDELLIGGNALYPVIGNTAVIIPNVQGQTTASYNLTAMGGGLQTAINRLTDATRPRSIVLFTDGMQNVNPMVLEVDDSPPPGATRLEIDDEPGRSGSGVLPTSPPTVLDAALGRKINTIGVGATPAFTALLQDIAAETDGVSKITTAPDNDLRRFYVEELVDVLRDYSPQLLGYDHGVISGDSTMQTYTVNGSADKVILKLSWKRGQKMGFRVLKDGMEVTRQGQVINGEYYEIRIFDPPLNAHGTTINAAGDWRMQISGQPGTPYETAAIAEETELNYAFSVGKKVYTSGEPIKLKVELKADGKPITDATRVEARVLKPIRGIANLLSETADPTPPPNWQTEAEATPGQKKLLLLQEDLSFFSKMQPLGRTIVLTHKGSGIYESDFADTSTTGVYTAIFTVTGERPDLGKYQRTESLSTLVRFGKPDFNRSLLKIDGLADPVGQWNRRLTIRPKDNRNNFLGPDYGHRIGITIDPPGSADDKLKDLADGCYTVDLAVPPGSDPVITIMVMGETLYQGPISGITPALRYGLSFHLGAAIPTGSIGPFANTYDSSFSLGADLEYRYTAQLSAVAFIGYNRFKSNVPTLSDTHWWNISANAKYCILPGSWRPYVNGGLGAYIPKSGPREIGFNLGAGVDLTIRPNLDVEVGVDYHQVLGRGRTVKFVVPRVGIIYRYLAGNQ